MNLSIFRKKSGPCDPTDRERTKVHQFSEDFLSLFIEKNSDGTRNLRLKGNELQHRIGRRLGLAEIPLIINLIKKYPTLVKIDLSYNRIDNTGAYQLCKGLRGRILESLILIGCDIECSPGGFHAIGEFASKCKLKILRMTGNPIGSNCGETIAALLMQTATLEILDIGSTHQTSASFPVILDAFKTSKNESLKSLDISDVIPVSTVSFPQPEVLAISLNMFFIANKTLTEIHLQKCALDGHAVEIMVKGLVRNKSLQFLDLGFNNIACFGAEKLAEWFKTSPELLGINLAGNGIGNIGGSALSYGLPYSKLRLLDLSKNRIKDVVLSEIILSIKKFCWIRLFYIFGNEIGPISREVLERQMRAEIYEPENIDFRIFQTQEGLQVGQHHNNYKQLIFNQLQPFEVRELRIRYNKLPGYYCTQRAARFNIGNYQLDTGPCVTDPNYEPPPYDEDKLRQRCLERGELPKLSAIPENFQLLHSEESSNSCISYDQIHPTPSIPVSDNPKASSTDSFSNSNDIDEPIEIRAFPLPRKS